MLADRVVEVPHEKSGLVQPVRRKLVKIADVDLMFQKMRIRRRAGQRGAANVLIFC